MLFHLFPYLEQTPLYNASFGPSGVAGVTAYDSTANATVYNTSVKVVQCPSDPSMQNGRIQGIANGGGASYACNFFAFGTATGSYSKGFPGPYTVTSWSWFGANRIAGDFPDGTSNTVFFAEKYARCEYPPLMQTGGGTMWAHPNYNSGQSWWPAVMAPDFVKYNANCYGPNAGAMFQVQPNPFLGASCDFTRASTGHSSGIQVALGDGSVRNVSTGISATTWWYAFSPNGQEPLGNDW